MVRRAVAPPKLVSSHTDTTQRQLTREGLPINTPLGITTGGRVRHIIMWAHAGKNTPTSITTQKDTLCSLFRPGTSLLREAGVGDTQSLCIACLKTLEAEVMRAKEAMRGEPTE